MPRRRAAGRYFLLGLLIVCGAILVDQYTKWLVMEAVLRVNGPEQAGFMDWFTTRKKIEFFINEREPFKTVVLSPFLSVVMVWNQGVSFGLLDTNSPHMPLVLIAVSSLISLLMLIWLSLTPHRSVAVALGLITGGALANVMDRVRFNAVADFIDAHVGDYHWPAFNVADSCIVIGAAILMLGVFFDKQRT